MTVKVDAVELALLRDLFAAVTDEMAHACMHTAMSPNIYDRRDLSAALFDATGTLLAHAAHVPVHLGAMPACVRAVREQLVLRPGDVALTNDPYAGGTHLPDLTVVSAIFDRDRDRVPAFHLAVRAHHADVGGPAPGSMAPQESIFAEGLRIPPVRWHVAGKAQPDVTSLLLANMRGRAERDADLRAQAGGLAAGERRLRALAKGHGGLGAMARRGAALLPYAATLARSGLRALRNGDARARLALGVPTMDGDDAFVCVELRKRDAHLAIDFTGSSGPVRSGLNATRAVTRSAVYHFVRCLAPRHAPPNEGLLDPVRVTVPAGSCLDATPPHAVAAGNVETSQRIVDALWVAAARLWPNTTPAPGAGSMSNWSFGPAPGGPDFPTYYETLPGGAGGGPHAPGADAIQQHMTNTRATSIERLESRWPVRVVTHRVRSRSGGAGRMPGGNGLVRTVRFLVPVQVSCLMTRHRVPPPGVAGGAPGQPGRVDRVRNGRATRLPAQVSVRLRAGDVLRIQTPGGGGWGRPA